MWAWYSTHPKKMLPLEEGMLHSKFKLDPNGLRTGISDKEHQHLIPRQQVLLTDACDRLSMPYSTSPSINHSLRKFCKCDSCD